MGSRYLTDMADVLRNAGLQVVELDGWERRARGSGGYDGAPWCVMWHHTASAGDGATDANYCTFRDEDAPLCNLVVGRDGIVYVCAGGATNTNGKGGPFPLPDGRTVPQDGMNSRAIGIEISNNGVGQTYPQVQVDACLAVSNALTAAYIGSADMVGQHVDWAPGRKIDPARADAVLGPWRPSSVNGSGSWRLADLRGECLNRSGGPGPTPTPPGDDDVMMYLCRDTEGWPWVTDFASYAVQITEEQGARGVEMRGYVKGTNNEPFPLDEQDSELMRRIASRWGKTS